MCQPTSNIFQFQVFKFSDPEFVFRFERVPANTRPGQSYRISDLELASRLSYFLWSSAPDETLLNLAAAGKLHETATLEQQVKRMLAAVGNPVQRLHRSRMGDFELPADLGLGQWRWLSPEELASAGAKSA